MSWLKLAVGAVGRRVGALSPLTILALCFVGFLVYAFPGYMSNDSVHQLREARSRHFTNPHPPLMAAQWAVLEVFVRGPLLMLLVQAGLFLAGLYRLLSRVLAPRTAALAAGLLLLFPPITTTMAVIWKDSLMAGYLMAATCALLDRRRWVRLIGLGCAAAACGVRYNTFAAAVPLVGLLFEWSPRMRWWRRYAISGLASLGVVAAAWGVNRLLVVETLYLTPAYTDIVGIVTHADEMRDEELRDLLAGTPLRITEGIQAHARKHYSARNAYWVVHDDERMFDFAKTPDEQHALDRVWKALISNELAAYVRHRLAVFRELLGLSKAPLWSPVWNEHLGHPDQAHLIDHDAVRGKLQHRIGRAYQWLADETWLFDPWVYAVLALAFLIALARDRLTFALLVSGGLYELSFAIATGTPDHRYSHWLIVCTCVTAVLLARRPALRAESER